MLSAVKVGSISKVKQKMKTTKDLFFRNAYLGNEFGHPEWLDFPRAGNNDSFHYARRLFYLPEDETLRYKYLNAWDQAMNATEEKYKWLSATNTVGHRAVDARCGHATFSFQFISRRHEEDKVVVFERGTQGLLFVFNFHTHKSFPDYRIGCNRCGKWVTENHDRRHRLFSPILRYKIMLNSDSKSFDGLGRVSDNQAFLTEDEKWDERPFSFRVSLSFMTNNPRRICFSPRSIYRAVQFSCWH